MIDMKFDVVSIGAALIDYIAKVDRFPNKDDEVFIRDLNQNFGGSATNFAYNCAKLGLNSAILAKIGQDNFGNLILDNLDSVKANIGGIVISRDEKTGICWVVVDPSGQRQLYAFSGASNNLNMDEINKEYIKSSKFLHIANLENIEILIRAAKLAKEYNTKVSINLGALIVEHGLDKIEDLLYNCDILILSEVEFRQLFGKADIEENLDLFDKYSIDAIVVTLGERGSLGYFGGKIQKVGIQKTDVVDTTGAGDGYCSGFMCKYLKSLDYKKAMEHGAKIASKVISKFGARL